MIEFFVAQPSCGDGWAVEVVGFQCLGGFGAVRRQEAADVASIGCCADGTVRTNRRAAQGMVIEADLVTNTGGEAECSVAADCTGEEAKKEIAEMTDGDVVLLENTRFHAGEEKNDPDLARAMADDAAAQADRWRPDGDREVAS